MVGVKKAVAAKKVVVPKAAATKKATAKKVVVPKAAAPAKKAAAQRSAYAPKAAAPAKKAAASSGYKLERGVLVKDSPAKKIPASSTAKQPTVVAPTALQNGISKARDEIAAALDGINDLISSRLEIAEAELSISFNAKGEFLGFGVGGAFSLKIKVKPHSEPQD